MRLIFVAVLVILGGCSLPTELRNCRELGSNEATLVDSLRQDSLRVKTRARACGGYTPVPAPAGR